FPLRASAHRCCLSDELDGVGTTATQVVAGGGGGWGGGGGGGGGQSPLGQFEGDFAPPPPGPPPPPPRRGVPPRAAPHHPHLPAEPPRRAERQLLVLDPRAEVRVVLLGVRLTAPVGIFVDDVEVAPAAVADVAGIQAQADMVGVGAVEEPVHVFFGVDMAVR